MLLGVIVSGGTVRPKTRKRAGKWALSTQPFTHNKSSSVARSLHFRPDLHHRHLDTIHLSSEWPASLSDTRLFHGERAKSPNFHQVLPSLVKRLTLALKDNHFAFMIYGLVIADNLWRYPVEGGFFMLKSARASNATPCPGDRFCCCWHVILIVAHRQLYEKYHGTLLTVSQTMLG